MFAFGLYAGEGDKTGGDVGIANTNPMYLRVFLHGSDGSSRSTSRGCGCGSLHEDLDLDAALAFWSEPRHSR